MCQRTEILINMKDRSFIRYAEYIFTGTFCTGIFIFFAFFYNHHLHFKEQLQLFLLTDDYFISKISFPGGFSGYLGGFLTQFYYLSLAGSLIITLLIFGIQQLTKLILFRINQNRSFVPLSFVPALFVAMIICDEFYPLSALIGFMVALVSGLIYINIKTDKYRLISGLALLLLTYWLAGGSYLSLFLMILMFELITFIKSRYKIKPHITASNVDIKPQYSLKIWHFIAYIVLVVFSPLLVKKYFILQPFMLTFMSEYYYDLRTTIPLTITVLFLLPVLLMLSVFLLPAEQKSYKTAFLLQIAFLFLAAFAGFRIWTNFSAEEIMTYDYLVRNEQWEEVIKIAEKKPPHNDLSLAMLNLSLAKTGQLGNKMFHFRQHGEGGLFLPFAREHVAPLMGNEIFYHLGLVNASQEYAFESMETIPSLNKSVRVIKRLAETNLINGNYRVSEKYLKLLTKTLFYRKWAQETKKYLYNDDLIEKHPDYGEKRELMIKEDFFFRVQNMEGALNMMLKENPGNKMAFEYLMAFYMINKDLSNFVNCIPMMENMDYREVPVSIQEAMMYVIGLTSANPLENAPDYISENTKNRMKAYADIYTRDPDAKERLSKNFSDTYWYYLHFAEIEKKME